jgi:putative component of membrane protein insertase Oxa1/YidC/SpoIIIJ protein YidD
VHRRAGLRVAIYAALAGAACGPVPRVGAPCEVPRAFAPFDQPRALAPAHAADGADGADGVLDAVVAWYQDHARAPALPAAGCPFAPTCSVYAREALHRYGPLGMILIVDRLFVREHPGAAGYYPTTCVAHTTRLVDGVP